MSLISLPEEVLETILLYVNVGDILKVLEVVEHSGSEGFWKRICLKNKYKSTPDEDETWQSIFNRSISWLTGNYVKTEYNISDFPSSDECSSNACSELEDTIKPCLSSNDIPHYVFHSTEFYLKKNTLLLQKQNRVLLMDVGNPEVLIGDVPGELVDSCNKSRTKLLIKNKLMTDVYSCDKDTYKKVFFFNNIDIFFDFQIVTDHYFIVLKTTDKSVTVFYFENNTEEYTFPISPGKVTPFNMCIFGQILNILILDGANYSYILRRQDLERREWLEDISLFGGATMIHVPQVRVNQRLVVCWSSKFEEREVILKVWTLEVNPCLCWTSTISLQNNEEVFWLELEGDYLMYCSSRSTLSIFNTKDPGEPGITNMSMEKKNFLGKNIIAGFLVLSYTNGFHVVDFKKGIYLYQVLFDNALEYDRFCINECFYIVYNKSTNNGASKKLCVYDFRGQTVTDK